VNRVHPSPPPGTLCCFRGTPNPHGAHAAAVYLFSGDATQGPVTRVAPPDGEQLPPSLLPLRNPMRIKLLHFNDLHGHICRFVGAEGMLPVFSRIAAKLQAVRGHHAADPQVAVLVVTAGDDCGGAIFDELLGGDAASFQLHAAYRLYTEAGVDVGGIGNHDLDRGDAVLAQAIRRDARFPVLAANVAGSPALSEGCFPAALFVVKGIRVGFVGLVTPAQSHFEPGCPWRITDPVQAAHNLIPAMRPLCDVLIILSHLGHRLGQSGAHVQVAGDVELARSLPPGSVDLIVGGHTHNVLNESGLSAGNIVNGIPIVEAGEAGQFVGEVDIEVGETAVVTGARLHETSDLPIDDGFERDHVRPLVELVHSCRSRILGRVAEDDSLSTAAVRSGFAAGESALANFITDAIVVQARARGYPVDFAMIDGSGVSCGLPVGGELTFGHWFDVMPYADVLSLCRLTGRQLRALLQDNAVRVDRPAEAHIERGFLHFSGGVRYRIALGRGRGQAQAVDAEVDGCPTASCLDRTFLVASISFVRGLAVAWEASAVEALADTFFDLRALPWEHTSLRVRDLLVDHILARGGVLPEGGAGLDGRLAVLI
jgi:5'-nucleotidase / UDP-sugar diphosphatase